MKHKCSGFKFVYMAQLVSKVFIFGVILLFLSITLCSAQQKKKQTQSLKDTVQTPQPDQEELLSPIFAPQKNNFSTNALQIGIIYSIENTTQRYQHLMAKFAISEINAIPGVKNINLIIGKLSSSNTAENIKTIDSVLKLPLSALIVTGSEQIVQHCVNKAPKNITIFFCSELFADGIEGEKSNVWKVFPPLFVQGTILAQQIDTSRYKKAALLLHDSTKHQQFVAAFSTKFNQLKGSITSIVNFSNPIYNNSFSTKLLEDVFKNKPDVIVSTIPSMDSFSALSMFSVNVYKTMPYKKIQYLTTSQAFYQFPQYNANPSVFENVKGVGVCARFTNRFHQFYTSKHHKSINFNEQTILKELKNLTTAFPLLAVFDVVYLLHLSDLHFGSTSSTELRTHLPILLTPQKGKEKISHEEYKNVSKFVKNNKGIYYECISGIQSFDNQQFAQGIPFIYWRISDGTFVQSHKTMITPE